MGNYPYPKIQLGGEGKKEKNALPIGAVGCFQIVNMTEAASANVPDSWGPSDEQALREALKRCSPATVEAAIRFRRDGDTTALPAVVLGIIERYLAPEFRPKVHTGGTDLRVVEDLGVDSLTMLEIVVLVEESLKISIKNEELRNLRTIGDINSFIELRVGGATEAVPPQHFPVEAVVATMPMQPPFLFIQEASIGQLAATGRYLVNGSEFFFQGHFKNNPVLPASIMLEALGQLAVLFLLRGRAQELEHEVDPAAVYFTGCEGVRCHRVVRPGDVLILSVRPKRIRAPLATFEGTIKVGGEKAAFAEEITLTFGYRQPTVTPAEAAPSQPTPPAAG
jgi:3-hydroxyacyl-[acyl-carrier-protein] dehydratase